MNDPQDWIDCKFTAADLHGKTVEYSVPGEDGHLYAGEGILFAIARGNLMRVRIKIQSGQMSPDGSHSVAGAIILPGRDQSKLVRNPPGSKCEFSFKAF